MAQNSIMSDEESFVILGSSPLSSLNSEKDKERVTPYCSLGSIERTDLRSTVKAASNTDILQADHTANGSMNNKSQMNCSVSTSSSSNSNGTSIKQTKSPIPSLSRDSSLAASFILGEVNADVLKTSVYSQFPSLCSMEACAEDVVKLQNFMSEYIELKNTLAKVNLTMKQLYNKTQQWKEDMARMEEQYKSQLKECQTQIATLRNENIELRQEIEAKVEHVRLSDELRQKDHQELLQSVSEKSAQIANMCFQIEKLEAQQLNSFEYIPKNEDDSKEKPDYVSRLEHQRIVKEHERKLSELLAENLDLKDVQKQYTDEITCLKVNLTSAEELINKSRADINLLKAKDMEKSEIFTNFERERDTMKEELSVLREQVNIYSKDFQMERLARQNLAGEKDQLLLDLRALQKRNQELLEAAQKQCERWEKGIKVSQRPVAIEKANSPARTTTTTAATASTSRASPQSDEGATGPTKYQCPICYQYFPSVEYTQAHVDSCLTKQ